MSRRSPQPIVIGKSGKDFQQLRRLPRVHDDFDENYLQELLADFPAVLPVSQLRDDAGDLLCIRREVPIAKGCIIDNLYLSSGGYPVIVETKLWRNPQARREVLSQVLDYVKELAKVNYEWLEEQWFIYAASRGMPKLALVDRLSEVADEELDPAMFVDRVNRALKHGDILAMIVGDGIESGLQELVAHLCSDSPHLRYALGLVELACYPLNEGEDGALLVVPRIVQEVEPIERAHVRIEVAPELEEKLLISPVVEEISKTPGKSKPRKNLTEEDFWEVFEASAGSGLRRKMEEFCSSLIDSFELEGDYKAAAVMLKVPDVYGDKSGVSVLAIERQGRIYNTMFLPFHLRKWGAKEEDIEAITKDYWTELHAIDRGFKLDGVRHIIPKDFIPVGKVEDKLDLIKDAVKKVVLRICEIREKLG